LSAAAGYCRPAVAMLALAALVLRAAAGLAQQTALPPATGHLPLSARVGAFEAPQRDRLQKPAAIIRALRLHPGMRVADIGAGSGYFTRRFAAAVGPQGEVYAVDIDPDILHYLKERAEKEHLHNIRIVVSRPDDPMLPPGSLDLAFLSETSHHIAHRTSFYRKIRAALKPDGQMAIIDYPPEAGARGWCVHKPAELVPAWENIREAEDAGFKLDRAFDGTLAHEYFLVFDAGNAWPTGANAIGR
jgi:arsenite methyltransferase